MIAYELRRVMEHIEVYDNCGVFYFSADTEQEAIRELEEMEYVA